MIGSQQTAEPIARRRNNIAPAPERELNDAFSERSIAGMYCYQSRKRGALMSNRTFAVIAIAVALLVAVGVYMHRPSTTARPVNVHGTR